MSHGALRMNVRGIWRWISRRFAGRPAPKLGDLLEKPAWNVHPLSPRFGDQQAWYVLFLSTFSEGHDVQNVVSKSLGGLQADITIVIGYFSGDPTEPHILNAAATDHRIVPLRVDAESHNSDAMFRAFEEERARLITRKQKTPQDCIHTTIPELLVRRPRN